MPQESTQAVATPKPFTIVVGLDFTDAGGLAFDRAAVLAHRIGRANIELLHVFEGAHTGLLPASASGLVGRLKQYIEDKAPALGGFDGIAVGVHLRSGVIAHEVAQFATDVSADLIVLGAHRAPHLRSWPVGSTAGRLVSISRCPVLLATPPDAGAKSEPVIEPPCVACVSVRFASTGSTWWCARHTEHARHVHSYSYRREHPFATHDSNVTSTGVG